MNREGLAAVRYDDRLETIAQIDPALPSGRIAIWHQLLDMLAQTGPVLDAGVAERSLSVLARVRPHIPPETRRRSVVAIAGRCTYPPLVAFLANDSAAMAIAAVDGAVLDDAGWLACLDHIGPVGRSRLRQRGAASKQLKLAISRYDSADFALADLRTARTTDADATQSTRDDGTAVGIAPAMTQTGAERTHNIAELVQRIDRYRAQRDHGTESPSAMRFDADGILRAVAGLNRAQFVGLSLQSPALPTEIGCCAGAARAFAKRAPIRNGRMMLPMASGAMECWLFDADPEFERETGRFSGYSGTLLRPATTGEPQWAAPSDDPPTSHSDGMRQLVHELRSPLNAISGFSQLIHGQFFGPVSAPYRAVAAGIIADTQQLNAALEDIELAAKLDGQRMEVDAGTSDLALIATRIAHASGLPEPDLPGAPAGTAACTVPLSPGEAERLVKRMLRCATQLGSILGMSVHMHPRDGMIDLAVNVGPADTQTDAAATGHLAASSRQGDGLFDLRFGLQLCSQLAELHGGVLRKGVNGLTLTLPATVRDMRAG